MGFGSLKIYVHNQCWCASFATSYVCVQQLLVPPSLLNLGMQSVKFWVQFHLLMHHKKKNGPSRQNRDIHHILSTLSYDIQGSGRNISYKQFILTV